MVQLLLFYLHYIIEEELITIDVIILEFALFACSCKLYIKNCMMYVFFFYECTLFFNGNSHDDKHCKTLKKFEAHWVNC